MSEQHPQPQSPLNEFFARTQASGTQSPGLVVGERAFLAHINLRGNPDDPGFLVDTAGVLGFDLPLTPNTWAGHEEVRVCWLGPDEWLLITSGQADEWEDAIRTANATRHIAVTEVSGGQTVLSLSGPHLLDVLAKGSTLDLHPRVFTSGQCAQSTLGKAPALYVHVDEGPTLELVIRRSFSDYVGHWLADAAHEFGLSVPQ